MEIRILSIASVIISMILYCSAFEENSQNANGKAVPIILFHGYGGVCDIKLQNYLNEKLGVFALCVEPSPDPAKAANYSIYTPIRIQGESACNMINQNPFFNGEFDLIGFSQGTIISRYIIQYCNLKGKVRNFVAFGGPLNGQSYKR